jgi:hypothetical protein
MQTTSLFVGVGKNELNARKVMVMLITEHTLASRENIEFAAIKKPV